MLKPLRLFRWLFAAALSLAVAACGNGDSSTSSGTPVPIQKTAVATVMIYMVGSDLESASDLATGNLRQMMAATQSGDVNIVITTGGSNKANPSDPVTDWRTVRRYLLSGGTLQMLQDLGKQNMGARATLSDFIVWAAKTYPADHYHLVLWDHGGGYYGFGGDEIFKDSSGGNSMVSVPSLQGALADAHQQTGIHFDTIGFDACMMAAAEVAHVLSPYADYLAASQENEPGSGWDYKTVLSSLAAQPSMTGLQLGRIVADSFVAYQKASGDADRAKGSLSQDDAFVTFSVTDLSRVDALLDAIKSFSSALASCVQQSPENWGRVAEQRTLTTSFGGEAVSRQGSFDLVDLATFADRLVAQGIATQASQQVSSAVRQAVVYRTNGALASNAAGMSLYFPARRIDQTIINGPYAALDFPQEYKAFLKTYVDYSTQQLPVLDIDVSKSTSTKLNAVVKTNFGMNQAMLIATVPGGTAGQEQITAIQPLSLGTGQFNYGSVTADFTSGWPTLNGHLVNLRQLSKETRTTATGTEEVTTYGIGAYVNGKATTLLFEEVEGDDEEEAKCVFIGTYDGSEGDSTAMSASRSANNLQPTDTIALMMYALDLGTSSIVDETPSKQTFPAAQMDLAINRNIQPVGSTIRLVVTDYTETGATSQPLPVKY